MSNITITVLSDDIEKSKRFARHLSGEVLFETVTDSREELVLKHKETLIRVIKPNVGQRGYRHTKLFVDSASPNAVEMTLEMFHYKVLPLFFPRFKLEIKKPVEYLDFDKEIEKYNRFTNEENSLGNKD